MKCPACVSSWLVGTKVLTCNACGATFKDIVKPLKSEAGRLLIRTN